MERKHLFSYIVRYLWLTLFPSAPYAYYPRDAHRFAAYSSLFFPNSTCRTRRTWCTNPMDARTGAGLGFNKRVDAWRQFYP